MPGLRNENYQTRNVMGAVTGLPGVRQRGEGISAATRLASDQAVIRVCVVSGVDPSDLVIMHDIRDDMFRPGGPTSAHLLGTLLARAGCCRISQGRAALRHDFTYNEGSEAGNVSCVTLTAAELCHNLASIRPSSSSAAGRERLACFTVHYVYFLVAGSGCAFCIIWMPQFTACLPGN